MGEEKKEYKGQSKIWFWVFSCIGLLFNILDMAAKAGGDYSTDFNGISIKICRINNSIFNIY